MFYTFSSTPHYGGRNLKRAKVTRACNNCRQHRVKCDDRIPCSRCTSNKTECVVLPPVPGQNQAVDMQVPLPAITTATTTNRTSTASHITVGDGMDSTVGFMSKISAYCSQLSDDLPPPYPSPDCQLSLTTGKGTPVVLSKAQRERLLEVYWARCHPMVPIISRVQLDTLRDSSGNLAACPLMDGVIALSIRYLNSSGLSRRLLGLRWTTDPGHGSADNSLAYFGRCQEATSHYVAVSEPTLHRVQCYLLLTQYLLEAGQYQPAYGMVGAALRLAHMLNLHHGLPDNDPDIDLARRVWWIIVDLDFRCARLLGCPVGVQFAEITCLLPKLGEFTYHACAVALSAATLGVTNAVSRHVDRPGVDRTAQLESRATILSSEIYRLEEWKNGHLLPTIKRPLHMSQEDAVEGCLLAPESLHGLLLELQYYDDMMGLHRPFIRLPNGLLDQQSAPRADSHALTAMFHAKATVRLTHRVMSLTDILYGRGDVYQWQWNALLTLIGFLMAYPLCEYAHRTRHHAQLALEIFSAADPSNKVAARAAALTRSLCAKVDSLVQTLKPGFRTTSLVGEEQGKGAVDETSSSAGPPDPDGDPLWSWMDTTDPTRWSTYSDGITGVLADLPCPPFDNDVSSWE